MTFSMSLQSSGKFGLQVVHQAEDFNNLAFRDGSDSFLQLTVFQSVNSCE